MSDSLNKLPPAYIGIDDDRKYVAEVVFDYRDTNDQTVIFTGKFFERIGDGKYDENRYDHLETHNPESFQPEYYELCKEVDVDSDFEKQKAGV